jgi:hypothetical protein
MIVKIAHQWTLDYYCPTVTVRPLFQFLTISRVIELHFKRDWSHWKAKTRGYKFSEEGELSSAPNIVKIAHQRTLDCYCPTFTIRPLFICLTISRVIEHHFKQDWSRWKAKTWGYKFLEWRRAQFYPQNNQNFSSTNIALLLTYCPIGSVMTQSRLVNRN